MAVKPQEIEVFDLVAVEGFIDLQLFRNNFTRRGTSVVIDLPKELLPLDVNVLSEVYCAAGWKRVYLLYKGVESISVVLCI